MTAKGINSMTGTVHYTKTDGTGFVQACGIKANQACYLSPVSDDAEVTCRKCVAPAPKVKVTVERKTFGRQDWSLTELREIAKDMGISGRAKMTGEDLLSAISSKNPRIN